MDGLIGPLDVYLYNPAIGAAVYRLANTLSQSTLPISPAPRKNGLNSPADQQAIEDVIYRHSTGITTKDWVLFRSMYTDYATVDYGPIIGSWNTPEAFTEWVRLGQQNVGTYLPRMSTMVIAVDGDMALSRTYVDVTSPAAGNRTGSRTVGYYDDEWVRDGDDWKITRRVFNQVRTERMPEGFPGRVDV